MPTLTIQSAGPGVTVQDMGRPGWKAQGLSEGGAADKLALIEAAALLGCKPGTAALEMMGLGGVFSVSEPTRFALTGATMRASIDGAPVAPNTTAILRPGERLNIGGASEGVYGYLTFSGGILTEPVMHSRATHLTAAIGHLLGEGETLPIGPDPDVTAAPHILPRDDRFRGGLVRIMPGPQTDYFSEDVRDRFTATTFKRSPRGNRQGVRLDHDGEKFAMAGQVNIVSDLIMPGDIQMTGDGVPFVLLAECQTIGGYPRIGTVVPADLPKVAQAGPGANLQFAFLTVEAADATVKSDRALLRETIQRCAPRVRDPRDIADLLGYQLISGMTSGDDLERP